MNELNRYHGRLSPVVRRDAGYWATLAVVLVGVITLTTRLVGSWHTLQEVSINVGLLRAAMQSAAGTPVAGGVLANMLPQSMPTGFQARALSNIVQVTGHQVTAETWLVHGLADDESAYLSQFELCLLYWNAGRRVWAREACRDTRASVQYWLNQGYKADQGGDASEALAYYEMASSVDPDLAIAWHQVGRSLFAARQYAEAVLAYERVLALDRTAPADVFDSLSLAYLALDNTTMARDVIERGLLLYPGERTYYLNMAKVYQVEGDWETADSWYARMLQRWPGDAQAWASRAAAAVEAGRLKDAVTYYHEAANLQPQGVGYWMNLAAAAASSGDVVLATDAYRQVMTLDPENVSNLLHAGRFFVKSEQLAAAREVFIQVLALQPGNREAATQLSELADTE